MPFEKLFDLFYVLPISFYTFAFVFIAHLKHVRLLSKQSSSSSRSRKSPTAAHTYIGILYIYIVALASMMKAEENEHLQSSARRTGTGCDKLAKKAATLQPRRPQMLQEQH